MSARAKQSRATEDAPFVFTSRTVIAESESVLGPRQRGADFAVIVEAGDGPGVLQLEVRASTPPTTLARVTTPQRVEIAVRVDELPRFLATLQAAMREAERGGLLADARRELAETRALQGEESE